MPWIEALVASNEEIVACERRFHRQGVRVVAMAMEGQVADADEMLLASCMTSLTLIRAYWNSLLADAPTDA